MPAERIKVMPNTDAALGMRHPHAEPLGKDGSDWPLDTFTCRRLADGSIRRAENEAEVLVAKAKQPAADERRATSGTAS